VDPLRPSRLQDAHGERLAPAGAGKRALKDDHDFVDQIIEASRLCATCKSGHACDQHDLLERDEVGS
jgi:hypothetical protein